MEREKIACIMMAAGAGARFGGGKLTSLFRGRMLIEYALDAVPAAELCGVYVVSGDPIVLETARARGFTAVENDRPEDGVSRTIRLGLEAAGACGAAMFMVADQPMLRRRSVEGLIASYRAEPDRIAALACDGRKGNPCIFPARYFSELARLAGDQGGSAVIRKHPDALRLTEVSAEELVDLDTREEMAIWE